MATKNINATIHQFRYYGILNENNYPTDDSGKWVGAVYDDDNVIQPKDLLSDCGAAIKIGIQTLPGVKFSISGLGSMGDNIIIDHTGVYELDLRNTTTAISHLFFAPESLARIDEIDNASIIVDVLCNPSEGAVDL